MYQFLQLSYAKQDPIYNFTEDSLFNIGQQVAQGLHFMAQSRILHGDIAARNILVGEVNITLLFG